MPVTELKLRAAAVTDHDEVVGLLRYLNPDDRIPNGSESREVFHSIVESPYLSIQVAEKAKKIVGACYLNIIPNLSRGCSPYALIENVITHPSVRREGIGKALLAYAIELAREEKCYKVMLLSGRDENVKMFYHACGMRSDTKTGFVMRLMVER